MPLKIKTKKNKLILSSLCFLVFILGANFALAASEMWKLPEIQYPTIPFSNTETPNQFIQKIRDGVYLPETALPLYVKYFYNLFLYFSGFIILGTIVWGGFKYLTASGAPGKMLEAKQWIVGGASGLIILFSSYVILITINPQLTVLSLGGIVKVELPKIDVLPVPESGTPVYFQVPTGKIIENAIINEEGIKKMRIAKETAEATRKTAEELKKLTEELKNLTDKCRCNTSQCSGPDACSGIGCPEATCDLSVIDRKIAQVKEAIDRLKINQTQILAARASLIYEFLELKKAGVLTSLAYGVIDYNTSLILKFYQKINIETFPGWEDIKTKVNGQLINDPVTFYFNRAGNEDAIRTAEGVTPPPFVMPRDGGPYPPPPIDIFPPPSPPPPGKGYCSADYLRPIFGDYAEQASIVCQAESGGNPYSLNNQCLGGGVCDYSAGLFQLNLLVRCPSALRYWGYNPITYTCQCEIIDRDALKQCETQYGLGNPEVNAREAFSTFKDAGGWCPWTTAKVHGI
ncbi:MAG: pilin [bacterium]|nr:pilin [bacterium]